MVASYIWTIFAQPDQLTAKAQLRQVAATLEERFLKVAKILCTCEDEILEYMAFPKEHHRQIHSTNPLKRLNKEIKRRADVVMMEQNDEWIVLRRCFSQESMSKLLPPARSPLIWLPGGAHRTKLWVDGTQ
jgi:putative transposase